MNNNSVGCWEILKRLLPMMTLIIVAGSFSVQQQVLNEPLNRLPDEMTGVCGRGSVAESNSTERYAPSDRDLQCSSQIILLGFSLTVFWVLTLGLKVGAILILIENWREFRMAPGFTWQVALSAVTAILIMVFGWTESFAGNDAETIWNRINTPTLERAVTLGNVLVAACGFLVAAAAVTLWDSALSGKIKRIASAQRQAFSLLIGGAAVLVTGVIQVWSLYALATSDLSGDNRFPVLVTFGVAMFFSLILASIFLPLIYALERAANGYRIAHKKDVEIDRFASDNDLPSSHPVLASFSVLSPILATLVAALGFG